MNPSYRNHKLGFKLKLAQRERVLTQGVKHITWTFDPLQSLNAHLNFGKLGVISDTYKINFYGEKTSSFLHQIGIKNHLSLEIPWNINDLLRERPKLAVEWRKATRWAFTEAFNSDYLVEDFYRATRNDQLVGVYLLTLQKTKLTRF